jgi:glycine oxidase
LRLSGPRCVQINGLYRHGFLIAPAILDVVLELMDTGRSALAEQFDLALIHFDDFEKFEKIKAPCLP